ncbi:speckle targeted PIP5K1A-regulated poly(A) polymerase [Cuculus canorus]|uniref:speckle targeted PIP5K1A-regulated poly(A) polymerase n=1 Tax=Cuculus canorus TaxID=55661 RepID=UPI0023AB4396|nr:speckle targeted PIP5K1A-regulated poly(A) polymerase [Cuculus canorus]
MDEDIVTANGDTVTGNEMDESTGSGNGDTVTGTNEDTGAGNGDTGTDPVSDPDVETLPRGGFRCRLCQISVANPPSLASHLRGRKHGRLRLLRADRRAQEQRSLFVSGFARGTSGAELSRHFEAYGAVAAVVMDKEKGAYAIVELQEPSGRERALAEPQHHLNGHRLRVRPREEKTFAYGTPGRGPRREPLASRSLETALCQAADCLEGLEVLLRVWGGSLQALLEEFWGLDVLLRVFEEVLRALPGGFGTFPGVSGGLEVLLGFLGWPCGFGGVLGLPRTRVTRGAQVDAQMVKVVELLELSEGERRLRHLLLALFQEVFTEFFPGCSVVPFGSSVNGFDAHGCDLDLFLDLEPTKSLHASGSADDSILGDIDLAAPPELLELVATVLRRCVPGVRRVRAVPTARRPVVKFCHKESELAGDISVDNRLALLNTRFLRLCAAADERVRPLVYAVRLWAKRQGLAGNPSGSGALLNNYALTLLVLFFLQTRTPPVLPGVHGLRRSAGDEDCAEVEGWNRSFSDAASAPERSANTQRPSSLLADFFHTFGDFDFPGMLISLREGRALPLPALPESFRELKLGAFNLQDPFELSHNVAANVNARTASRFQRCCRDAAKYSRSLQFRRKSGKGRIWGITRLFQPGAVEPGAAGAGAFLISIPVDPGLVGSERPGLCSERSGVGSEHPGVDSDHPSVGSDHPGVGSEHPGVDSEHPGVGSEHPGLCSEHSGVGSEHPGVDSDHPSVGSDHPGVGSEHPGVDSEHPGVGSEHPGLCSEHPGVGSDHPGVDSERPGLCSEHPSVGSEHPGVGSEHPGVGSERPGVGSEHPGLGSEHPGVGSEHPGVGSEHPGVGSERPGVDSEHSGIGSEHSSLGSEHPGLCSERPGVGSERPGVDSEHPGVGSEHPGLCSAHPGVVSEHSGVSRIPWFRNACSAIAFVLKDILKCVFAGKPPSPSEESVLLEDSEASELLRTEAETPPTPGSKRCRPETPNTSTLPGGKRPRMSISEETANWECAVWHRVWTGRRRFRRQLRHRTGSDGNANPLDLEQKVSETIIRQEGTERPPEPLLRFRANARSVRRETRVLLRLIPASPGPLFQEFFHFLRNFLPAAVRQRLERDLPEPLRAGMGFLPPGIDLK